MRYKYKERPWYVDMFYHIRVKGQYVLHEPQDTYNVSTSVGVGKEKRLRISAGTSSTKVEYIWRFP
jgi:hypothetical protein